jgi:hypothetical protein
MMEEEPGVSKTGFSERVAVTPIGSSSESTSPIICKFKNEICNTVNQRKVS